MTDDLDIIDLDNTVNEEAIDPEKMSLTLSKQKFGKGAMDDFLDATVKETSDGKHLMMEISMEQAQRWADTLAARLHDYREQAADQTMAVDEVYLVCISDEYGNRMAEPETVAFTRRAAVKAKREIDKDLNYGREAEIQTIDYTTA